MKKSIVILLVLLLTSCCLFRDIEVFKQKEEISQNTYALRDSLDYGRYDLSGKYIKELIKLIVPPSKFIEIRPVVDRDGRNIALLPDNLNTQKIIVVGSSEYQRLLSIQEIAQQLAKDNINLINNTTAVDNAVREQAEAIDALEYERDRYKNQASLQSERLSKKNITITLLLLIIAGYAYIKSGLRLPFI